MKMVILKKGHLALIGRIYWNREGSEPRMLGRKLLLSFKSRAAAVGPEWIYPRDI